MKKTGSIFLVLLISFLVTACGDPLPAEKMNFAGTWASDEIYLQITPSGRIEYKSIKNGLDKSLSAPIQEFADSSFKAGMGPFNTTFVIDEPPTAQDGRWTMVIDGERLYKTH